MTKRRIAVLGCTGSIGTQTLSILAAHPDRFEACMVSAHRSRDALEATVRTHRPAAAVLTLAGQQPPDLPPDTLWFEGEQGLLDALDRTEPDVVLNAITGAAGLAASEWTLRHGRTLALANKESLVVAGDYLMPLAKRTGARILPVDSEHCAIFQCLDGEDPEAVRRVLLTGSGGPFRTRPMDTFATITKDEALRHPTWKMGPRITIGSATMMNKAFEVLEAHWLFDLAPERIEVVLHPQSIVHSMVEYRCGSILAQCGVPDMRAPILFCLGYPERLPFDGFEPFSFDRWRSLEFHEFEPERYPAVALAYQALRLGGDAGALLNAADEVATEAFLNGQISFPEITQISEHVLRERPARPIRCLADAVAADREGRRLAGLRCGDSIATPHLDDTPTD
ncbi:MAG: 1-deoxy-D-xylulose-5-phosphate reductoisomerase [Planctomycetota bacterium]